MDVLIAKEQAEIKELADELDKRCKAVAEGCKREDLATANDVTYQAISKMLNTNGGQSSFGLSYIPSIAKKNPDRFAELVVFFLCDLCGREHPDKKHVQTDAERLKQMEARIRRHALDRLFEDLL